MKITKHVDKTVTADACFTHYGHSKNIGYTWISQKKKTEWNCCQITTRCLQRKNTKILDDIRNNVGTEFLRDHIIDKQDVINIQRAYGLEEVQRHANDQTSVLAWIQEWQNSTCNPVVWYKLQGIFF